VTGAAEFYRFTVMISLIAHGRNQYQHKKGEDCKYEKEFAMSGDIEVYTEKTRLCYAFPVQISPSPPDADRDENKAKDEQWRHDNERNNPGIGTTLPGYNPDQSGHDICGSGEHY